MKQVLVLKLQPTPQQADSLRRTMESFNAACNSIAEAARDNGQTNRFRLQQLVYRSIRERFSLSAQMTIRAIGKVTDALKLHKAPAFRSHGAVIYDQRVLSRKGESLVSIWTLDGRQRMPFSCRANDLVSRPWGQSDLVYRDGMFLLHVTVETPTPSTTEPDDALGVDLGIVNLATESDGTVHTGEDIETKRRIYAHRRRNLQRKRTRSAHRKLRKLRGRQARFQRDVNHRISKAIVSKAKRTSSAIVLEDLRGIRQRVTARRRQRARLSNWSFSQLQAFIAYKAALAGVVVVLVDPRNTSRQCPACGHIDKANRKDQSTFCCKACALSGHADTFAARNIASRARAAVIRPMVANELGHPDSLSYKLPASAGSL